MRLVLDTDVIVAAMRSPTGGSAALLRMLDQGRATMLLSTTLALEYEAKCLMPEHREAAGFSMDHAMVFVNALVDIAEEVKLFFRWRPQVSDPGDEMVLEAAANGRANAIVTFNAKDYRGVETNFGIDILSPGEALRRIRDGN